VNSFVFTANTSVNNIDPLGLKLYNIVVEGAWFNPMEHNVTMHIDDTTGVTTYYEVTGNLDNAHVYKRTKQEFIDYYKWRIPELVNGSFCEMTSIKGKYEVIEVTGVDEAKSLGYMNNQFDIYKKGAFKYPYVPSMNNCTTFSYKAYEAGLKQYTPEPGDLFKDPYIYPRDLNQAIIYHNNLRKP
jgi:hypothetical protein